ncbi:DUF2271 domain-containing protein [Formosa sp. S-31]|uniref:DUF2271 domain-containing protein n=1 Tax=Formosa sp. S-31 TaxID=2790949 RepID=UPI003EB7BA9A
MKKITIVISVLCSVLLFSAFKAAKIEPNKTIKCMIQTKKYTGEPAYIAVSLLDASGKYEKTLRLIGNDDSWFNSLLDWWKYLGESDNTIDAVSGATITPGDRSVVVLEIPESKIDKNYSIRFESAVEKQEYYNTDLEIALTTGNLQGKFEGTGYVRYVRLMAH